MGTRLLGTVDSFLEKTSKILAMHFASSVWATQFLFPGGKLLQVEVDLQGYLLFSFVNIILIFDVAGINTVYFGVQC